jgi:16S rRNA (cytosine967-C5)-methyltransferase
MVCKMKGDVKRDGMGERSQARPEGRVGTRGGRSARAIAAEVLRRIEVEPETRASELLAAALARVPDGRERALATELVYGVLRWRRRLDFGLAPFLARGLGGVEPMARALLRVGAYQVRRLDRIPPEIAVSATQDAAREAGFGRLTGLVNAVLRKVVATPEALPEGGGREAIGVRASLPDWMVVELEAAYGDRAEVEGLALRDRAEVTLRPTLGKGGQAAAKAALVQAGFGVSDAPGGMLVVASGDPFATRAFADGLFVAQDPASLAVVDVLEEAVGELSGKRILDLCAGRGVKATAMLDRGAQVVAVDIGPRKLEELGSLSRRLGVAGRLERVVATDASAEGGVLEGLGEFDAVLVDAPCSGLGTIRRHPELAWRRQARDVDELVALQQRLVETGARRVRVGGALVYAVCTFVEREGQASIEGFELEREVATAPSSGLDAFQARVLRRVR